MEHSNFICSALGFPAGSAQNKTCFHSWRFIKLYSNTFLFILKSLPPVNLPQGLIIIGIPQRKPVTTWSLETLSPFRWESPKWQNPPQVFSFLWLWTTRGSVLPVEEAHNFNHWTTRKSPFIFLRNELSSANPQLEKLTHWSDSYYVWGHLPFGIS